MDFADIAKVNLLSNEKQAIQQAVEILDDGGRIIGMTVGTTPAPPSMAGRAVGVQTGYIDYPAQMLTAIHAAFETRLQQITEELAQLGVTGVPPPASR